MPKVVLKDAFSTYYVDHEFRNSLVGGKCGKHEVFGSVGRKLA
jgi:hypothetical protein